MRPKPLVALQGMLSIPKAEDDCIKEGGDRAEQSGQRPVCTLQTQGCVNYDYFYMATEP